MSKHKSRRVPTVRQLQPQPQETRPQQVKVVAPAPPPAKAVNFQEEYRYILSDLKRFGILAVAMFATLIVLALALG